MSDPKKSSVEFRFGQFDWKKEFYLQQSSFILKFKYPFNLTEWTANVNHICKIVTTDLNVENPVILDTNFKVVKDSNTTRGMLEIFFN